MGRGFRRVDGEEISQHGIFNFDCLPCTLFYFSDPQAASNFWGRNGLIYPQLCKGFSVDEIKIRDSLRDNTDDHGTRSLKSNKLFWSWQTNHPLATLSAMDKQKTAGPSQLGPKQLILSQDWISVDSISGLCLKTNSLNIKFEDTRKWFQGRNYWQIWASNKVTESIFISTTNLKEAATERLSNHLKCTKSYV